ncbi:MAG: molybdenum cofactor guanylyltransferase [Terrimicrobiaceae bacterium]|nr:molybdenum cofactor guanylyltransferase [Terrimicrobiaceae bacterium]
MTPCAAALLAGGKSSRMGRDKCLIEIDGIPLWRRQWELLGGIAGESMIVAPVRPGWCPPDLRWVADAVAGCGPLGGLAVALAAATHDRVLILAVDLPGMNSDYLKKLLAHATGACGIVPVMDRLFQPLSAVYPRSALAATLRQLATPDKSLQPLLRRLVAEGIMKSAPVEEADRPLFRNLNTPGD